MLKHDDPVNACINMPCNLLRYGFFCMKALIILDIVKKYLIM